MKTTSKFLFICLSLLIVFSFLQCSRKHVSDCNSKKMEMLVDDMFNKLHVGVILYFTPLTPEPDSDNPEVTENLPEDSNAVTYYLYSSNIKFPEKDYYLYYHNHNNSVDSIKLNKINDLSNISDFNCLIGMHFLEVNADSTKIKVVAGYGYCNHAGVEITNTDTFDVQNCKWIVLDSTKWQY